MFNWKTASALIVGGAVVVCGITLLYLKKNDIAFLSKRRRSVNEVLFYGSNRKNMNRICVMCMICDAEISIEVCLPQLTNEVLTKNLINLKREKPVKIRVLIHKERLKSDSLISKLIEEGIEVKCDIDEELCYEFIVIDGAKDGVLLMGALDRPMQDSRLCQENAVLTSETVSVNVFVNEFERLWASADINV